MSLYASNAARVNHPLTTVENEWKSKKVDFDKTMLNHEQENATLDTEVSKLKDEVYKEDSKINILKYTT